MNLLAHAYLSFDQPDILIGNMISDYVKGKQKNTYAEGIQKGIILHRAIDNFTDHHPATDAAKKFFQPHYRLYAGPFVDIVYDHFLANDSNEFENKLMLSVFCSNTYTELEKSSSLMPEKFSRMIPYMIAQNWLYNYRLKEGIRQSFNGLVRRAAYLEESVIAYEIFNEEYNNLQTCYRQFFPALKTFAVHTINQLNNN